MRMANVGGRAAVLVGEPGDERVLDAGPDVSVLCDLASQPRLRDLGAGAHDVGSLPRLDEVALGPPVPRPGKIVALALNYRSHAEESGLAIPDEPHVFAKFPTCVTGPHDPVVVPAGRGMVDYEAEIVVAIGRAGTRIAAAEVWDHIAGITCGQDISDRGEQFRPPVRQFTLAKSYDTFGPIGPVLTTPDGLPDRDDIAITGWVDGEEVQRGSSVDLIFSVPHMIEWLSRFMTFEVGDLIFTGTPGGVGEGRTPPLFLKPGMVVETEVAGVGRMRNEVVGG